MAVGLSDIKPFWNWLIAANRPADRVGDGRVKEKLLVPDRRIGCRLRLARGCSRSQWFDTRREDFNDENNSNGNRGVRGGDRGAEYFFITGANRSSVARQRSRDTFR